ncbi:hypothetical protein T440DRAFT_544078 [Plenodomus tracheiphilus IPT5]|uniref:Uncharacterized protein n=1 Tax=Plenodomus tracheiphilus IPT5 TaxID=1408161 RepID=A0A6A7AQ63_9PLEO|nr:hypothetical protein T440DRAFT_544078 [Plenodomus tracheiphilus IPT5]
MKLSLATVAVLVVASANAIDNCTVTSTIRATHTFTDAVVSTYSQGCDEAKFANAVYTTTYHTTLAAVGPSGISSTVYPVTAVATGTKRIDRSTIVSVLLHTRKMVFILSDHSKPPGFTTTAVRCTACPGGRIVTVTIPISPGDSTSTSPLLTSAVKSTATAQTSPGGRLPSTTKSPASQFTGAGSAVSSNSGLVLAALLLGQSKLTTNNRPDPCTAELLMGSSAWQSARADRPLLFAVTTTSMYIFQGTRTTKHGVYRMQRNSGHCEGDIGAPMSSRRLRLR